MSGLRRRLYTKSMFPKIYVYWLTEYLSATTPIRHFLWLHCFTILLFKNYLLKQLKMMSKTTRATSIIKISAKKKIRTINSLANRCERPRITTFKPIHLAYIDQQ